MGTLIAVALLGAYHGINPGMGWLFAVALGLQERRRNAVVRALFPIAIGHELSVALVVVALAATSAVIDERAVRVTAALVLFASASTSCSNRSRTPNGSACASPRATSWRGRSSCRPRTARG